MAQAALGAELVTGIQRSGQVAAFRLAGVGAGGRTQLDLAGDVVIEPAVADLAVHPHLVAIPAGEQTQGGVGLGEVTLVVAEVGVHAAVAGETAEHHAVLRPVHAEQAGRGQTVVQVSVVVALHVATHATPPAHAVRRATAHVQAHLVGARPTVCAEWVRICWLRGASRMDRVYWPSISCVAVVGCTPSANT